eukprot:TRINITY_DN28856_c0_g1_i2.p1 TRINITY_DN28856_c0_g1~~TRINITY_DN28856_c0_g1_i2.p1  ORF type:complete len:251 (-),score=26.46 TRINITY_DN28856_c0_g1_i2:76-828(-)
MELHDALETEEKTLEGIVLSNAYDGGLFPTLSRFNHSCVPNCEQSWNSDEERSHCRLFAIVDVPAGEELNTYYTDVREPSATRANKLWDIYRFECKCPACLAGAERDRTLARILELEQQISEPDSQEARKGLQLVQELVQLFQEVGITLKTHYSTAYFRGLQFALRLGDRSGARGWAEKAHAASLDFLGADHAQTQQLLKYWHELGGSEAAAEEEASASTARPGTRGVPAKKPVSRRQRRAQKRAAAKTR